jgi:biopolymer transport protein ExbD/biopolymer transport protein TolR
LIKAEEITTRVDEMIAQKLDKTVYVKSDARAKYGDVVKVVDIVRNVGVDHLGLLTERIEQATGPASFGAAVPTTTP